MKRYSYKKREFDFGDFVITKREILVSISIIAVMLLIGVVISNKISEHQLDQNEICNKAVKIESSSLFQYGMDTNIGIAFVYGELKAVDTVTYPELGGKYMYIEKVKEEYTEHTRTVTYKDRNDKEHTKEESYWTWDRVDSENIKCNEVNFCGITFNRNKIELPNAHYIDTIEESDDIRYLYYGVDTSYIGTIFTNLKNKTISNDTKFYNGKNIEETIAILQFNSDEILFWVCWIILIGICVFFFYYSDNKWLK